MDKSAIRKEYLELRKTISNDLIQELSIKISNQIIDFLQSNQKIRHVHLFLPISRLNEVNTFPLFERLQDLGYYLYTSYLNPETNALETLEITETKEFESGDFGIPIPKDPKKVNSHQIQLVLVPLLAFDSKGNRLGYGKGYYDKFFASISHKIIKAGLSFFPPMKDIPAETHDIGLDICITPDETYHFSHF